MVQSLSRPAVVLVAALAMLAGFVDGFGFVNLGGYFVSFMSGNTTRVGVGIAGDDLAAVGLGAVLIASFVVGAMSGTIVAKPGRRRSEFLVLLLVTAALAVGAVLAAFKSEYPAAACLAFAMGAVNTAFSGGGEVSFGITYMTGALVKIGQGIVRAFRGGSPTAWTRYLLLWAAILLGAVLGAWAQRAWGEVVLWFAVGWALAVAVALRVRAART